MNTERQVISDRMYENLVAMKKSMLCTLEERQKELRQLKEQRRIAQAEVRGSILRECI